MGKVLFGIWVFPALLFVGTVGLNYERSVSHAVGVTKATSWVRVWEEKAKKASVFVARNDPCDTDVQMIVMMTTNDFIFGAREVLKDRNATFDDFRYVMDEWSFAEGLVNGEMKCKGWDKLSRELSQLKTKIETR